MIKVIIADDEKIFRESLKFIFDHSEEIEVVGCAENGREALELCDKLLPDIVLMDIIMPVCDGVEGTRLIKNRYPSVKVLILTTFGDEENISRALKNGADGYILKDMKPKALIQALKSVAEGIPVVHQKIFQSIKKQIDIYKTTVLKKDDVDIVLSEREIAIIRLIVGGRNNKEIASITNFTEGSVRNIVTEILRKLKLRDRTQLAIFAIKNNLV